MFLSTQNEYRFLYHSVVEAYMSHQTDRPMESFHRSDSLGQVTNEAALKTKDIHREFSVNMFTLKYLKRILRVSDNNKETNS